MDRRPERFVITVSRRQPRPGQVSAPPDQETNLPTGTGQNESGVSTVTATTQAVDAVNTANTLQNSQGHNGHTGVNDGANRAQHLLALNANRPNPMSEGDLAAFSVERGFSMHSLPFSLPV